MLVSMRTIGALVGLGMALGACSSVDFTGLQPVDFSTFTPRSTAALSDKMTGPVTPQDMVDEQGRCVGGGPAAGEADGAGGESAGLATLGVGVALNMTECEVVQRLGAPERVSVGQNEGNQRVVSMTYTRGNWPGVYQFTAGRLTVMERAAAAAAPARARRR